MNRFTAPAAPNAGFCRSARSRQGFARCARRYAALTRPARFARKASIGAAGILERKETQPMLDRSLTPSITVTIGRYTRLYFAFITTAPAELDSPATITLLADTLLELSCYAEDPFSLDTTRSQLRRAARARGCHRVRLAVRQIRGERPSADRGGSRDGRLQHAAATALALCC